MLRIVFIVTIVVLSQINVVQSWRNYKLNLLSMKLPYVNTDWVEVHAAEIKKVNRTHSFFKSNFTTLKEGDEASMKVQFYQYVSNRYRETFPKVTVDVCSFLIEDYKTDAIGFIGNAINKLKAPLLDMITAQGQKFPKRCPVPPDNYHLFVRVDEEKLPAFFLPAGRWKVDAELFLKEVIRIYYLSIVFEIVNYSSEKQKQHG